jgi:hypothetical protein
LAAQNNLLDYFFDLCERAMEKILAILDFCVGVIVKSVKYRNCFWRVDNHFAMSVRAIREALGVQLQILVDNNVAKLTKL